MDFFEPVEGGIELWLPPELADWLADLPAALDRIGYPGDPAAERLNAPVYLDDPEANAEWRRWMDGELDQSRAADRSAFTELVAAAVDGTVASPAEAEAFLRVLVEARLMLAARFGVDVESDYEDLSEREATTLQALGEIQVLLIQALAS